MGDLIHTLPALSDAQRHDPAIRFDWVAEQSFAEIPAWHPAVDTVIKINLRGLKNRPFSRQSRMEISAALRRLRAKRYDAIIDAQGLIKSAIVTGLARGIPTGMNWASCKEGLASLAYRKRFEIARDGHAIDRLRELFAKCLGYRYDSSRLDYGLKRPDFPAIPIEKPYLVFLHGSGAEKKCWDHCQWIELAHLAEREGYRVVLPHGNSMELARAKALRSVCANIQVLPGIGLTELAGVLAGARGVVGVDTGLAHLGAALGSPATTLYIATSPVLTGARGQNQLCLATSDRVDPLVRRYASPSESAIRIVTDLNATTVWRFLLEQIESARGRRESATIRGSGGDAVDWTERE